MNKLSAKDLQDIGLAEHAKAYMKQQQQNRANSNGSVNTKSNLENRSSKQKRIQKAKAKYN